MAKFDIEAPPSGKAPKRRRRPHDASLLFCCMDVLQIDHNKLARDEPLLYRELQGVCTLCPNKRDCAFDLSDGFDGMRWDEWWLYCPNSAMLTTIGALQKCRHPPHYNSASAFSRLQLPKEWLDLLENAVCKQGAPAQTELCFASQWNKHSMSALCHKRT